MPSVGLNGTAGCGVREYANLFSSPINAADRSNSLLFAYIRKALFRRASTSTIHYKCSPSPPAAKMHGCQSYELIEWPCSTEKAASPIKVARSASAARTAVSGAFRHWPIADNSSCAHMHLEPSSRTKRAASNATPLFLDGDRTAKVSADHVSRTAAVVRRLSVSCRLGSPHLCRRAAALSQVPKRLVFIYLDKLSFTGENEAHCVKALQLSLASQSRNQRSRL